MARTLLGLSSIAWVIAFFFFGRDLLLATKVLFAATALSLVLCLPFWKQLKKSDWGMLVAALVFSGLTIYFDDLRFIKWRPTVVNLIIALVLFGLYAIKKAPFEYLFGKALELQLPKTVWLRVNLIWGGYMVFCAALNAYLILMNYSHETWMTVKSVVTPIISIFFMMGLFLYLFKLNKAYGPPPEAKRLDE